MNAFKALAIATVLAASSAGMAFAADTSSPFEALDSASTLHFESVTAADAASIAGVDNTLDLTAVRALVSENPNFMAQLKQYGATLSDIVGISAHNEGDVTLYVMG